MLPILIQSPSSQSVVRQLHELSVSRRLIPTYARHRSYELTVVAAWLVFSLLASKGLQARQTEEKEVAQAVESQQSVDYGKQVAPLMAKNCVACHNAKKAEGGLNLESHQALIQGGDSGASIVAGDAEASILLQRILDNDDPMPPDGNAVGAQRLTEAEASLVRAWIMAGAAAPAMAEAAKLQWQALPPSINPINALAASSDGNYLAIGRGNQAFLIRNPVSGSMDQSQALIDPEVVETLRSSGATLPENFPGAAHLDVVQSIAFSPDSSRVAVGGYRSVKIWRRQLEALDSLATGLNATQGALAALSPDGRFLAVSAEGRPIEFMDLQQAKSYRYLKSHEAPVTGLVWIDANTMVSVDQSGKWMLSRMDQSDVQTLTRTTLDGAVEEGKGLPAAKHLLALSSNSILAVGSDGRLYQLQIDTSKNALEPKVIDGLEQVTCLTSGQVGPIAVGLGSGACKLVDRQSLAVLREIATSGPVHSLAMNDQGTLVASTSGTAPAQLFKAEDGSLIASLDKDYKYTQLVVAAQRSAGRQQALIERLNAQHAELKKAVEAEAAALAKVQENRDKAAAELAAKEMELAKANEAATAGQNLLAEAEQAVAAAMKLVETRKAELDAQQKTVADATAKKAAAAEELAKRDQALATSQDAKKIADSKVPEIEATIAAETKVLDSVKLQAEQLANDPAGKHQARGVAFASDGSKLAVADESGRIHLFSTLSTLPEAQYVPREPVSSLIASKDGRLMSLSQTGWLHSWDLGLPWKLERVIGNHVDSPFSDRITALDFSPDGKSLAVGSGPPSRYGEIKIIDPETGSLIQDLGEVHSDTVLAIRYSPDGKKLASAGADKLCRILDAQSGKQIVSLEGHTHHVLSVAWKDDGVTLATGSGDLTIKLWNTETATQLRTVGGAKKEVTALSFVGASNQFIAVDASGIVRLIDAGNGNQVRAYAGAEGAVLTVALSPDGKFVFAGGQAGSHWAWQTDDAKKVH